MKGRQFRCLPFIFYHCNTFSISSSGTVVTILLCRIARAKKKTLGARIAPVVTIAARSDTRLPMRPTMGPPAICPMASAWPLIEITVARILGSLLRERQEKASREAKQHNAHQQEHVEDKLRTHKSAHVIYINIALHQFRRGQHQQGADQAHNAKPGHGIELSQVGESEILDEVRRLETIKALARHAGTDRDTENN